MNLAAIVATAFAAIPSGLSGTGTLARTTIDSSTVNLLTDAAPAPGALSVAGIPVVLDVPRPDRVLPPGLTMERARVATMPAASLGTFVPRAGDELTIGTSTMFVVESTPTDPSGSAPALYELLVRV